jgi:hypothetical protein
MLAWGLSEKSLHCVLEKAQRWGSLISGTASGFAGVEGKWPPCDLEKRTEYALIDFYHRMEATTEMITSSPLTKKPFCRSTLDGGDGGMATAR